MASFLNPKPTNSIVSDLAEIRTLLTNVAKGKPDLATDVPTGAKRFVSSGDGISYQWEEYDGSSWRKISKLAHNVDMLDGYHASIEAKANTIPVYNSNALLVGGITGNAYTATKLKTPITIDLGGVVSSTKQEFDGSTNITIPVNSITVQKKNAGDPDPVNGVLPITHGGTGREDGVATDVEFVIGDGNKAQFFKAKVQGQIGRLKYITADTDLDSLVHDGVYAINGEKAPTIAKHWPETIAIASIVTVRSEGRNIFQEVQVASARTWRRLSYNSGDTWTGWSIGDTTNDWTTYYVSTTAGKDENPGTLELPFATIARALRVAGGTGCGSASRKVQLCLGEGDWGNVTLLGLPFQLEIYPYTKTNPTADSTSLPKFGTLTISNSYVTLHGVVIDKLSVANNAHCMIDSGYKRIAGIVATYQSTVSFASNSATTNLWEIHNSTLVDAVISVSYNSLVALNGYLHIKMAENTVRNAFLVISDGYFSAYNGRTIVDTSVYTLTGKKFMLYNGAEVRTRESTSPGNFLQSLPGTDYTLDANATVNGISTAMATASALTAVDTSAVHQAGEETITGVKTFTANPWVKKGSPYLNLQHTSAEVGNTPTADLDSMVRFLDKNGSWLAEYKSVLTKEGTVRSRLNVRKNNTGLALASIGVEYPASGSPFGTAPTTPASAVGNEIVTADYLKGSNSGVVHTSGGEEISGEKVFLNAIHRKTTGAETNIILTNTGVPADLSAPSTNRFLALRFNDAGGNSLGVVAHQRNTTNGGVTYMSATSRLGGDVARLEIVNPYNGDPYATAPTPADTANNNHIVTTKWARTFVGTKNMHPSWYGWTSQSARTWYTATTNGWLRVLIQLTTGNQYARFYWINSSGGEQTYMLMRSYNSQSMNYCLFIPITNGLQYKIDFTNSDGTISTNDNSASLNFHACTA